LLGRFRREATELSEHAMEASQQAYTGEGSHEYAARAHGAASAAHRRLADALNETPRSGLEADYHYAMQHAHALHRRDHRHQMRKAPAGTKWAIGTELHLVNRLKAEHPEQEIHFLSPVVCMCATMYRIDLAHLCWSLERLAAGEPVNVIEVDPQTTQESLVALTRMLEVKK